MLWRQCRVHGGKSNSAELTERVYLAIDSSTTFPSTKLGLADPTYGIAPSRRPACPTFLPKTTSQSESLSTKEVVPTWVGK